MFCTKCGKELPDNVNFCSFCGQEVRTNAPSSVTDPAMEGWNQASLIRPMTEGRKLSQLNLKELDKLNFSSLFLVQMGILNVLGLIYILLISLIPSNIGGSIGKFFVNIVYCVVFCADTIILFKIRSKAARIYLFIQSILLLASWALAVLYFIIQSGSDPIGDLLFVIGLASILPLFVGINLLIATKRELLWGEGHFSRAQIKKAYSLKKLDVPFDDKDLPPADKAIDPAKEKIIVAIGYASLILSVLIGLISAISAALSAAA